MDWWKLLKEIRPSDIRGIIVELVAGDQIVKRLWKTKKQMEK